MTTALAERPIDTLPKDQIELIRRTVANGATNDELALFLYDCQRRGIHPLDKLLHFTKRGGKYTPVTSIDYMRSQAAMTGEMAGSDDPIFTMDGGKLVSASVTVYRITQGQRFAYGATARWSEYCPDNAPMWKRMPHTMLGKCAEALALRKAFPQQLAGLYAREEMDQADGHGYVVEAPAVVSTSPPATQMRPSVPNGGDSGRSDEGPDHAVDVQLLEGMALITRVEKTDTKNASVKRYLVTFSDGVQASTIKEPLAAMCEQCCQNREPVFPTFETKGSFTNLVRIMTQRELDATKFQPDPDAPDAERPF